MENYSRGRGYAFSQQPSQYSVVVRVTLWDRLIGSLAGFKINL